MRRILVVSVILLFGSLNYCKADCSPMHQSSEVHQTVCSNHEVTITVEFDITVLGETYHVVGSIHIGNERQHFVEAELSVYDSNGNLRYHIETSYNENGERTGLIVIDPSGEPLADIPYEINAIMGEVDLIVTNALQNM